MADHVGWRNFWWLNVALFVLTLIMTATMFPESKWHRIHPNELGQALSSEISTGQEFNELSQKAVKTEGSTQEDMTSVARTETAESDPFLGRVILQSSSSNQPSPKIKELVFGMRSSHLGNYWRSQSSSLLASSYHGVPAVSRLST